MTQYIPKDALVAEIEKRQEELESHNFHSMVSEYDNFLSSIDTLEVKEVDLEREIDNYLNPIEAWQIQEEPFSSMEKIARHFFELGMWQSNNDNNNEEKS